MEAVSVLRPTTGVQPACQVLGMSRATWYRHQTTLLTANTDTGIGDAVTRYPVSEHPIRVRSVRMSGNRCWRSSIVTAL